MRALTIRNLFVALLISWLTAVLIGFYVVQKPFGLANALAVLQTLDNLLTAGLLVLTALGLGRRLLAMCRLRDTAPAEEVLLSLGTGFGLLALLSLGLGMIGVYHRPLLWGLLLVGLVLTRHEWKVPFSRRTARKIGAEFQAAPRFLLLYLGLMVGMAGLRALAPPISFDALLYHLTGPQFYLRVGRLIPFDNAPFYHPSLMPSLYLWALGLAGDSTAKLLHFAFALLIGTLLFSMARRYASHRVGWWSVALFASLPMVSMLAGWAYADLGLAFYELAAVYALFRWHETGQDRRWLAMSGIMAGFAMSVKYTSFVLPLGLVLLMLYWAWRQLRWSRALPALLLFGTVAGIVALPWYLRNWWLVGNPVYPFLSQIFGGRYWDGFRAAWYAQAGSGIGLDPLTILTSPWVMTLGYRDATYYDARTGPLFLGLLPFVPLVFWYTRHRTDITLPWQPAGGFLFLAGFQYLFWLVGIIGTASLWQARLLLPAFVFLCLPLALTLDGLSVFDHPQFSPQKFVLLIIALVLGLTMVSEGLFFLGRNPLPVLVGLETRDSYLQRNLGTHYFAMKAIGKHTPADAHVLFLYEPRSYYSPRPTQPDALLDNFGDALYHYNTTRQVVKHWREERYTHVLIYWWGVHFLEQNSATRLDPATQTALQTIVQDDLREIYRDQKGDYVLYEIAGSE